MFKSLTDKFYYIITTDEIVNMPSRYYIPIINVLFDYTDNHLCSLFPNGKQCMEFIKNMNARMVRVDKSHDYVALGDFNAKEDQKLDVLEQRNTLCLLTNHVETLPDGKQDLISSIEYPDDLYGEYDFVLRIVKERILDKNLNLKKILKKVLKDDYIRMIVETHNVDERLLNAWTFLKICGSI